MTFWRFVSSFLYTRNWHTGRMELSRPRVVLLAAAMFLTVLAITLIIFLQTPIHYLSK